MPRTERTLDPTTGPVAAFAAELRRLRAEAGSPKYLQMARRTGRSRTALAEAAGGDHLPSWATVQAYVTACGGEVGHWLLRWEQAKEQMKARQGDGLTCVPFRASVDTGACDGGEGTISLLCPDEPVATDSQTLPVTRQETSDPDVNTPILTSQAVAVSLSRFGSFAYGNLAAGRADGVVEIWDLDEGAVVRQIDTHDGGLTMVQFDPLNRDILASAGGGGLVRVWDVSSGRPISGVRCSDNSRVVGLAFDPCRAVVAAATADGVVRMWDYLSHQLLQEITTGVKEPHVLRFDSHHRGILAVGGASGVQVWEAASGELQQTAARNLHVSGVLTSHATRHRHRSRERGQRPRSARAANLRSPEQGPSSSEVP